MAQSTLQISAPAALLRLERGSDALKAREYRLTVLAGPDAGKAHVVLKTCIIGSHEDAGFLLSDPTVSRFHAELEPRGDGIRVRDLDSTNGTFLGGARIQEATLEHNADLTMGKSIIRVTIDEHKMEPPDELNTFGKVVGAAPSMKKLFGILERVATTESTVFLLGETGTGKEVLAQSIHQASRRHSRPFVVVDCGSVAANLIESELFGHVKGAFTGAIADRSGAFLEADGGTIFLDEIGELPLDMQPKLLRVLESGTIKRVGEDKYRRINVRVLAATHRNLEEELQTGRFRRDLYYRLAVVVVTVPPLRERIEDIPLLTTHFMRQMGRGEFELPRGLLEGLREYQWPGNVRELRNVVERALAGADIEPAPATARTAPPPAAAESTSRELIELPFKEAKERLVEDFTREYLTALLEKHQGNISQTARAAGIARNYVHRLVAKYGLRANDF